jgi:hypothetical protein
MLALVLALALSQAPAVTPTGSGPAPSETAKLFFLAGDVSKALEIARAGVKKDGKRCRRLVKLLAEYGYLVNHMDEFTPDQARQFIELDAQIAPGAVGKLTQKTIERFIDKPLEVARLRAKAGDVAGAAAIARDTLKVDPQHAETLAFLASLEVADAGGWDAGR